MTGWRAAWPVAVSCLALAAHFWHGWLKQAAPDALAWSYGGVYALLAIGLLGALARYRVTSHAPLWRMFTVLAGAALSALDIVRQDFGREHFMPLWAAALLGVAGVALAARLVPAGWRRRWLGDAG